MRLSRKQLEALAALHRDYCERVGPALEERAQLLARLSSRLAAQAAAGSARSWGPMQSFVQVRAEKWWARDSWRPAARSNVQRSPTVHALFSPPPKTNAMPTYPPTRPPPAHLHTRPPRPWQHTLDVEEAAAALARTVQVEQAGWVSMSAGLYGVLDFPLQKLRATLLCAPYFPNGMVGSGRASGLGMRTRRSRCASSI